MEVQKTGVRVLAQSARAIWQCFHEIWACTTLSLTLWTNHGHWRQHLNAIRAYPFSACSKNKRESTQLSSSTKTKKPDAVDEALCSWVTQSVPCCTRMSRRWAVRAANRNSFGPWELSAFQWHTSKRGTDYINASELKTMISGGQQLLHAAPAQPSPSDQQEF